MMNDTIEFETLHSMLDTMNESGYIEIDNDDGWVCRWYKDNGHLIIGKDRDVYNAVRKCFDTKEIKQ